MPLSEQKFIRWSTPSYFMSHLISYEKQVEEKEYTSH